MQNLGYELPRIPLLRGWVNSVAPRRSPQLAAPPPARPPPPSVSRANHAPGVEVAGELVLIAVARHQHDDAPIIDVLQVYGGRGTQIAREDLRGLDHYLLADPSLG